MIEHIIHAVFHAVQEHYNEKNEEYEKQQKREREIRVQKNQPKIRAIMKDCEAAVLYAARTRGVTLNTKKWDANIDYEKMCQYLIRKGYPSLSTLDMKLVYTLDPISFLAKCACDRICDELKIEY